MPIFSSNRVSGAGAMVVAAEGYTEKDFGRILSECAVNDMRLFNAAIARDFKEAQALSEGTMVASEIKALQEFSIKEAWKGLKEKLKKLWAKIKGVFKAVYAKLSLWLNRNTKTYIAQHRKELLNKDCSGCKISKFRDPKGDLDVAGGVDSVKAIRDVLKLDLEKVAVAADPFKSIEIPNTDEIFKALMEEFFNQPNENLTFGGCYYKGNVQKLFDNLSGNSKYLKDLRKASAEVDKLFKAIIGKLDKAERKAEGEDAQKAYANSSKAVSNWQAAVNAHTSAMIKVVKKAISNDRGLIAALVAYNPKAPKNESAIMTEFAFMAGYDALHEETEDLEPEDIEAAAEEEGIEIEITVKGDVDADVTVNDETDD